MAKFKYNGDKEKMVAYGYDFSNGQTATIPDDNELVIKKLLGNSHFDNLDGFTFDPETQEIIEVKNGDFDDSEIKKILDDDTESIGSEKWGIFKKKSDGSPYKKPEKVFSDELELYEVENYVKENFDNPDDYIIMKK